MSEVAVARQPAKCTGQGRHKKEVRGPELYPTPREVTQALIDNHPLPRSLLEPAAGMGHMVEVLEAKGHSILATDLHDYGKKVCQTHIFPGIDFLNSGETLTTAEYGAVVTNPPFSIAADFVRRGLELAPEVIVLGRLAFLEGQRRRDIIEGNLAKVLVFENRLPMMHRWSENDEGEYVEWSGEKASSAMAFAWFSFKRDWAPCYGAQLRRIRWKPGS